MTAPPTLAAGRPSVPMREQALEPAGRVEHEP